MFENELKVYETELRAQRLAGKNRGVAKSNAKHKLYASYPEMQTHGMPLGNSALFWAKVAQIVENVFSEETPIISIGKTHHPSNGNKGQASLLPDENSRKSFMSIMRNAAASGFIPKPKYLEAFCADVSSVRTYISHIRGKGYECTENEYGWICKLIETPEQIEAKARSKRLAEETQKLEEQAAKEAKEIEARINELNGIYNRILQLKRNGKE